METIQGNLPIIVVQEANLALAWEVAVLKCWHEGARIPTQYDKPGDPPSRDCMAIIRIDDPFAEPRIHRAFPGGPTELEAYRQEVVDGIHDHWVDPANGKWEYTYHERLFNYTANVRECVTLAPGEAALQDNEPVVVNQIACLVDALVEAPHTRRAQAITWKPWEDNGIHDPACLQRIWCRIFEDRLVMNVNIRSNDAYKAGFMNMFAFTDLQRYIAAEVSERLGHTILPGCYTHVADSFHIYGSYFAEFQGFLDHLNTRSFDQRTWTSEEMEPLFVEAREQIARSIIREQETGIKGISGA